MVLSAVLQLEVQVVVVFCEVLNVDVQPELNDVLVVNNVLIEVELEVF